MSQVEISNLTRHWCTVLPCGSIHEAAGFILVRRGIEDVITPITDQDEQESDCPSSQPPELEISVKMCTSELNGYRFNFHQDGADFMSISLYNSETGELSECRSGDILFESWPERVGYVELSCLGEHDADPELIRVHSAIGTSFTLTRQSGSGSNPAVLISDSLKRIPLAAASAVAGREQVRRTNMTLCWLIPVSVYENSVMAWHKFAMVLTEHGMGLPGIDKVMLMVAMYAWMLKVKRTECHKRKQAQSAQACALLLALLFVIGYIVLKLLE